MSMLKPLLSWKGCVKESTSSYPSPRSIVGSALAGGEEYVALLESGGGLQARSRYSIIGLGAVEVLEEDRPREAYSSLDRFLGDEECYSMPCRAMAFLAASYEAVIAQEPWLRSYMSLHEWPVITAFKPETLIVYDHAAGRVVACGRRPAGGGRLREFTVGDLLYETGRDDFIGWVDEARRLIEEGEAFQIVLSRVKRYDWRGEPFTAYERLAGINPSPYMFYIKAGRRVVSGTSPELLVKLDGGVLETHPIAGTRPRGDGEEDIVYEEEMLSDPKELAEHVMLIDLARNDLTMIAVPGTTRVATLMDVEKYSHVQHIVSRVEAQARPGLRYADALRAMLPAGTVSGAPKPRAMEIIARLEDSARGPYAGAVGIAGSHAGETAITIRSFWTTSEGVEVRAGAGIVYDSMPEREYMETEYKLRAILKALGGV